MEQRPTADDLSIAELKQALYRKQRAQRRQRLARLQAEGRVVTAVSPPETAAVDSTSLPSAANGSSAAAAEAAAVVAPEATPAAGEAPSRWRWLANKTLLLVEVAAVVGLAIVLLSLFDTQQELNQELASAQRAQAANLALPTPTATPVIDVVVLPSGHKPPVDGRAPEPGEAGDIPAHLLPAINAYKPPPAPTPGPRQARRVEIPTLGVDSPIVQGDDWEQLKKGVGQHIGSALPGQEGNLVLSAHNDIYGEIFRDLEDLAVGDQIHVSTDVRNFTYVVTDIQIVEPTDVWVMQPTDYASVTLISCYPYRINTHRIVVFADLVPEPGTSG